MELKILQFMYDLNLDAHPVLRQFPKSERMLVGEIRQSLTTALKLIIRANTARKKGPHLEALDAEVQVIKYLFRLSYDLKFMSSKRYGRLSERIIEIGRMLGGWIKSSKGVAH